MMEMLNYQFIIHSLKSLLNLVKVFQFGEHLKLYHMI